MAPANERKPGKRAAERLFTQPITVWRASRAVAMVTLLVTLAGGVLVRVIDPSEFSSIGESLWWSLQTVTTVGYGDVVPENAEGRIVGAVLMIAGVGFLAVITASIVAAFTQAALQRRFKQTDEDALAARIDELIARVDKLEETVRRSSGTENRGD